MTEQGFAKFEGVPEKFLGDSGHLETNAVVLVEWLLRFRRKMVRLFLRAQMLNNWTPES
jgi:hypothetical protein